MYNILMNIRNLKPTVFTSLPCAKFPRNQRITDEFIRNIQELKTNVSTNTASKESPKTIVKFYEYINRRNK